jgi:hypothetical protein
MNNSDISSEVWKGVHKNFRSPKEREEFQEAKRRNDAHLDTMEARQESHKEETDRRIQNELSEELEPLVHNQMKRGNILSGPQRRLSFSSLPT